MMAVIEETIFFTSVESVGNKLGGRRQDVKWDDGTDIRVRGRNTRYTSQSNHHIDLVRGFNPVSLHLNWSVQEE